MSDERQEFRTLLAQAKAGSQDAASTLVQIYGPQIRTIVRRQMTPRLRPFYDSEDFVQSVWASFIRIWPGLTKVGSPDQLMALLTTIAQARITDEARRRTKTIKHSRHREIAIESKEAQEDFALADGGPTPSAFAIARETWDQLIDGVPDRDREILRQRCRGATYTEIAKQIGIHEQTVRRAIEKIIKNHAEAIRASAAMEGE